MRHRPVLATTLILLAGLLAPGAADAKPKLAGTFDLSGQAGQMTRGSDGNIWVVIIGGANPIARVKPSGAVKEYSPAALVNPVGITAGPDGNLWLTRPGGVVRVPPNNPNNAQDFNVAAITDAQGITRGPQKKLWAASGDRLVSFKPNNPVGADDVTINGMNARGIAASGKKLWIADFGGARIVRVTPAGAVKRFGTGGTPQQVASGPGGSVAYGNPGTDPQKVGRIRADGTHKKSQLPTQTDPFGIAFAPDKRWWFAAFGTDRLGILSQTGKVSYFRNLPAGSGPRHVAVGKNNTLWVSLEQAEKVARITGI